MVIRPATLADKSQLVSMIMHEAKFRYPQLRADSDKVSALVTDAISSAKHYAHVVEEDGAVKGALIAFTSENAWAQRMNSCVMFWVSEVPGAGARMLIQFRDWVKSRRAIRVAGFCPDIDLDPRVWMLAEKLGFKRHGGAYLLYSR